jgi:hypothetical protein
VVVIRVPHTAVKGGRLDSDSVLQFRCAAPEAIDLRYERRESIGFMSA